jgi:hypothetical protein
MLTDVGKEPTVAYTEINHETTGWSESPNGF